jgi:hypothetical protein
MACTVTPTNIVAQVRIPSAVNHPDKIRRPNSAVPTSRINVAVNAIEDPEDSCLDAVAMREMLADVGRK